MQHNKQLGYARDDVFIISTNEVTDKILEIEAQTHIEPEKIYIYFAYISALYSKTHSYINKKKKLGTNLITIRKALYDKTFQDDLSNNPDKASTKTQFLKIFDSLINLYRGITEDFTMGIFPKVNKIERSPGVIKKRN